MLNVATFAIGPLQVNCYVLYNEKEALVIDPGGDVAEVLAFVDKKGLAITHIVCTHLHFDHTYGVADLQQKTGAATFASKEDGYMLESVLGKGGLWDLPEVPDYTFTDLPVGSFTCLETVCEVRSTPGHSPGSISLYVPDGGCVFSGDTLFERSVGRSDLPGGDQATLIHSIRAQLYTLPDATIVYPGHGRPTTVSGEKLNNPFVSDFAE